MKNYQIVTLSNFLKKYDFTFEIAMDIKTINSLIENLKNPFIIDTDDIFMSSLSHAIGYTDDCIGIDSYVSSLSAETCWIDKLKSICDVDEGWTVQRNKNFNYIAYIKMILKKDYYDVIKAKLNEYKHSLESLLAKMEADAVKQKAAEEAEKAVLMTGVKSVNQEREIIVDDGGKTVKFIIDIVFSDGTSYKFVDRNIFDFGRVINPCYQIADGLNSGLVVNENNRYYWQNFIDNKGWCNTREIIGQELQAYRIVQKYYGHFDNNIRM